MDTPTSERPKRRQSDQILDGWTWGRVTKIGGALMTVGAIVVAVVTFLLSILVTRPQLHDAEKRLTDSISVVKKDVTEIKEHQAATDSVHMLLVPMAKLECIRLNRENSGTLADLAGLPCYRLMR